MANAKALGIFCLLVGVAIYSSYPTHAYQLLDLKAKVLRECWTHIHRQAFSMPERSSLCCKKVEKADVKDICNNLTDDDKVKIDMVKWVQVTRKCENPLPAGFNCAGQLIFPFIYEYKAQPNGALLIFQNKSYFNILDTS